MRLLVLSIALLSCVGEIATPRGSPDPFSPEAPPTQPGDPPSLPGDPDPQPQPPPPREGCASADPGETPLRRLNRFEYDNTVRDRGIL